LEGLPISTENIFYNYDESSPATVEFRLSNGNSLAIFFPERGRCYMIPTSQWMIRSPSDFKRYFDVEVAFVPVLGPVEHNEPVYQKEAARLALLSHGASRNFRNIWYHFPNGFDEFRRTIQETSPGMDIQPPELVPGSEKTHLCMFCPEERFPREIFWAGFGFQVRCQMLTFILRAKASTALVIDGPDIYLHSDLQRQLVGLLKELFSELNTYLQQTHKIALSPIIVVESFLRDEICPEVVALVHKLDALRKEEVPDQPSVEFPPASPT